MGTTPSDTLTLHSRPQPTTYEEAMIEVRFMCEAYRVVLHQRDVARKSEKSLQDRIANLKATLSHYMGKAAK